MSSEALERAAKDSRAKYVAGTPEKYPRAELRGFTILEADALLAEVARLEQERDEANAAIRKWEKLPGGWEAMKAVVEEHNKQLGDLTTRLIAQRRELRDLHEAGARANAAEADLAAARAREQRRDERDDWLRRQLDGAIEAAEAVAFACGLATARALFADLKDARAAEPAAGPEQVVCPGCDGAGWYTAAEHEPGCDGGCDFCPVPVQRECETCGGSGFVLAAEPAATLAEPGVSPEAAMTSGSASAAADEPHERRVQSVFESLPGVPDSAVEPGDFV